MKNFNLFFNLNYINKTGVPKTGQSRQNLKFNKS